MMNLPMAIAGAAGLKDEDRAVVRSLMKVWQDKKARNDLRMSYYKGHVRPKDLGIAIPPNLKHMEQVVGWAAKAVDMLANRSIFDGFTTSSDDDEIAGELREIAAINGVKNAYRKACTSELICGCSFVSVAKNAKGEPLVRFYPATAGSAIWDYANNTILAGLVIVERDERAGSTHEPIWVDVFTKDAVISLKRYKEGAWRAEYAEHSMGRPLIEPLSYNATLERPFGRSRITRSVMNLVDDAMRTSIRSEVSAEFFSTPQRYLLGAPSDIFETRTKWDAIIGRMFTTTKDEDGDIPQYGQLPQGTMQPHIDYMKSLAARFSGETNVPMNALGVISDSNPQSAEAMQASREELVIDAQNLNDDNASALKNIARMSLAILHNTDYETELMNNKTLQVKWKSPAMPSIVSQSDAVVKQVSCINWLGESDVILEELGYSDEQVQRLQSDRRRFEAKQAVAQVMANNIGAMNGNSSKRDVRALDSANA